MLLLALVACHPKDVPNVGVPFESELLWSTDDDWEPTVAADPASNYVYEATTRIDADFFARTVVRVSADGGTTWGGDSILSDDYTAYDPQLAVARDTGCVVFAWLGGPDGWSTFVRTSCDHGESWTAPVSIAPDGFTTDHGWLTVSPNGHDVFVAFNGAPSADLDGQGYVAVSRDWGKSFTDTLVVGDGLTAYWFEDSAALADDGTLYVANAVYSGDYTGPADLVLWRSIDHGQSFQTSVVATSQDPPACDWAPGCKYGFFGAQSAVAVDPDGAVLFLWSQNDVSGDPMAMFAATSPGGDAWDQFSAPFDLSGDAGNSNFPSATSAGPGDFRIAWQGSASGSDPATWNTWYQESADGGETWLDAPLKLSDQTSGAPYKRDVGYAFPYGDYFGLSVGMAGTFAIWAEGPHWNGPGGTWSARRASGG